jgi:hypothetical protein
VTDPKLKPEKVRSVEATVVLALALAASSFSTTDQQAADFQSLYERHHWFALRDAVSGILGWTY